MAGLEIVNRGLKSASDLEQGEWFVLCESGEAEVAQFVQWKDWNEHIWTQTARVLQNGLPREMELHANTTVQILGVVFS